MTRKNSFDAIRLFAATLVVFAHSFALSGHSAPGGSLISLGAVGVWIFFILSGYLISKSWEQYPRFNVFFAKRALRIFPALIVVVLATIAACGLFFTTLPLKEYLFHQETWNYLNNILLYNNSYYLPGVFADNISPRAVNGSIWTLAYEFTMYIAVALIGVVKLYKRIPPIAIWLFLLVSVTIITLIGKEHFAISIFSLSINELFIFALIFFSGVMMHKYEKKIRLNTWVGIATLILFIGLTLLIPSLSPVFAAVFLAYGLFSVGRHGLLSGVSKYGDFSYGVYIYAFPVQQMVASATQTTNPMVMFALSMPITLVLAILSWHFVESKALAFKSKINIKRYPLTKADEAW